MKVRTQYNWIAEKRQKSHIQGPSKTIQGQSYTIPELIQRYSNGLLSDQKEPLYMDLDHNDPDLQQMAKADMVDKQQTAYEQQAIKIDLEAKIKASNEVKQKQEAEIKNAKEEPLEALKTPSSESQPPI